MLVALPIITLIIGAFLGGFITHKFALGRERQNRQREMLGFLEQWRVETARAQHKEILDLYRSMVPKFADFVGRNRPDIPEKRVAEFNDLAEALMAIRADEIHVPVTISMSHSSTLQAFQIDYEKGRQLILAAIAKFKNASFFE